MSNQNLLNQTYEGIKKALTGGGKDNFQLLDKPEFFSRSIAQTGQINRSLYQIISRMPQWSELGSYSPSSKKLSHAYRSVLDHVIWKVSPERQNALNNLKDKLTMATNDYNAAERAQNQAYINAKNSGGMIFEAKYPMILDWLSSPAGEAFSRAVEDAATKKNLTQDLYNQQGASEVSNKVAEAMKLLEMPTTDPNTSPAPRGWAKVEDGAGELRWEHSYTIGMTGQELSAKLTDGSIGGFSFTLDASRSESSVRNSWAKGSASRGGLFWEVNINGSWQKLDIDESDTSVKATFSAKSSTTVPVSPDDWFNAAFMRELGSGTQTGFTLERPFVPISDDESTSMFGAKGILSTQVAGLVVAYQPSITIEMSSSTFNRVRQKFEASAGFRYGPFQIGGSGGHSSDYSLTKGSSTSFTMETASTEPVIIGVVVAFPGLDKPTAAHLPVVQNFAVERPAGVKIDPFISNGKGLNIYSDGKIRLEADGRYHFHVEEI